MKEQVQVNIFVLSLRICNYLLQENYAENLLINYNIVYKEVFCIVFFSLLAVKSILYFLQPVDLPKIELRQRVLYLFNNITRHRWIMYDI